MPFIHLSQSARLPGVLAWSVLVGRERLNQSLNFAIPADAFYAP